MRPTPNAIPRRRTTRKSTKISGKRFDGMTRFHSTKVIEISPSGFTHRRNTSHHGKALQPINYHNHHKSHCAMAFYTRPWESTKDTVMVSIDGVGEGQCATIYNHKFELLHKWDNPKSVGLVYTTATDLLGLRPLEDEYVVMGLSSYGTAPPDMVKYLIGWWNSIRDFPEHKSDAEVIRRMDYRTAMRNELTKFLAVNSREDFAAGIQEFAKYGIMTVMTLARQWGSKVVYGGGLRTECCYQYINTQDVR